MAFSAKRRSEVAGLIQALTSVLTARQRLVTSAYWFDGHTFEAIGERLEMPHSAVAQIITRAADRLRAAGMPVPVPPHQRRIVVPALSLAGCSPDEV